MDYTVPFFDHYNAVTGAALAIVSYIFGEHWLLFAAFLLLNVADWITGWMKSYVAKKENSQKGWTGVMKKVGYWLMIALSFGMSAVFIEIGEMLGIDLHVTALLGWFVLAALLTNEIRSILENLVEAGFNIPEPLIKGLEVADKAIKAVTDEHFDGVLEIDSSDLKKDTYRLNLNIPIEDLQGKDEVRLKVDPNAKLI